jgi:hypothetical protein
MSGYMCPPAGHALDYRQCILRLLGDTERPRVVSASEEAPAVVVSDLVAVRERRLAQEAVERFARDGAMDEDEGFTSALRVELELPAVDQ